MVTTERSAFVNKDRALVQDGRGRNGQVHEVDALMERGREDGMQ